MEEQVHLKLQGGWWAKSKMARILLLACLARASALASWPLATPRPIPANAPYMESLAAAGLISRQPRHTAPADPWRASEIKGVKYLASTANN